MVFSGDAGSLGMFRRLLWENSRKDVGHWNRYGKRFLAWAGVAVIGIFVFAFGMVGIMSFCGQAVGIAGRIGRHKSYSL